MDGPLGNNNGPVNADDLNSMLAIHANGKHHHHHLHRSRHAQSSSPEGNGSDFIKEELTGGDGPGGSRLSSSSSVASGRSDSPMDEDELSSKEHLRLLISGSRTPDSPHYRFVGTSNSNKSSTARDCSVSPKPGLLAFAHQQQHSIGLPVRTSSPKLPESSSSGRRGLVFPSTTAATAALFQQHLLTAPHPLYQQIYAAQQQQRNNRSTSPVDSLPEQENPIDLSCKSSSSSPRPFCHIRAEILTGLDHDDDSLMMADDDAHRQTGDTGAPLDLTTKG